MADNDELQTAVPLDTVAARKLIAKIKKGDAENAAEIANLKDYVDGNVLRIAPPESAGDGEVIFYRGQLLQ